MLIGCCIFVALGHRL